MSRVISIVMKWFSPGERLVINGVNFVAINVGDDHLILCDTGDSGNIREFLAKDSHCIQLRKYFVDCRMASAGKRPRRRNTVRRRGKGRF